MKMNLPNKLAILRIILVIPFVIFLSLALEVSDNTAVSMTMRVFAAIIFVGASITDYYDGKIARKYNLITNMGKFLDPLADKLLVGSAFIVMVELGLMHSWMVVVVIAREFAVTGLRLLAVEKGEVIPAGMLGKLKTISQLVAIVLILLGNPIFNTWNFELDYIILWISVILTILSGIEYFKNSIHVFK